MEIFINEEESLLLIKALENLEYNNYEKMNIVFIEYRIIYNS